MKFRGKKKKTMSLLRFSTMTCLFFDVLHQIKKQSPQNIIGQPTKDFMKLLKTYTSEFLTCFLIGSVNWQ